MLRDFTIAAKKIGRVAFGGFVSDARQFAKGVNSINESPREH